MCKIKKIIKLRLKRICSCCGKPLAVIIYTDKSYRGGHYFGKIPISTDKEWKKALKAGTRPWNFYDTIFQIMKKDPVPYKYIEDWECLKCYWKR